MEIEKIVDKFGRVYRGDEETLEKGTHHISARKIARRFKGKGTVIDACCGAGFVTMHLARNTDHVFAVDINKVHLDQAEENIGLEGLSHKVTFIHGDILEIAKFLTDIDGSFLDPNWTPDGSLTTPHATTLSQMQPDGNALFNTIAQLTPDIAFRLPKEFDLESLSNMPAHEIEVHRARGGKTKFYCAYFGDLQNPIPQNMHNPE